MAGGSAVTCRHRDGPRNPARLPTAPGTWPTNSSSMPSLMVGMLEALKIADEHQVLELRGKDAAWAEVTGTG